MCNIYDLSAQVNFPLNENTYRTQKNTSHKGNLADV